MKVEERTPARPAPTAEPLRRSRRDLAKLAPWAICLLLAAWAPAASVLLFPQLTNNNDEAVYLLQADALRHGYLFPPAPDNWEAFLPWFAVHDDDRFVLKYTPVHAAIIAACQSVFGSERAAMAVIAAAAAATAYLLAAHVLRSRRQAAAAAAFFALSPLVLIQSATYLSYLSALALLQGFAAATIVGIRGRSSRWLGAAGFIGGVAIFARPYDALLFAVPVGLWAAWTYRSRPRDAAWAGGWIAVGAALPLIAMLSYFYAATGSPFDPPFNVDPSDTLGFGPKRMTPGGRVTDYTPALAWVGLAGNLRALVAWSFGGIVLAGLVLVGLRRMRLHEPGPWLALIALTIPAGYFFFWGSYGTVRWGGPTRLGPHYYLPLLTPLCILGARGFSMLWHRTRVVSVAVLTAMVALSGSTLVSAVEANRPYVEGRRELYHPLTGVEFDNALVFLPAVGSKLVSPYALSRNHPGYDGDVLWAVDRGSESNLEVLGEFPDRVPYRVVPDRRHKMEVLPKPNFESRLERQMLLEGAELELEVVIANAPASGRIRLAVAMGPQTHSIVLGPLPGLARVPLLLGPGSVRFEQYHEQVASPRKKRPRRVEVFAYLQEAGGQEELLGIYDIDAIAEGGRVRALVADAPPAAGTEFALFLGRPSGAIPAP